MHQYALLPSPLGPLLLEASWQHLTGVYFTDESDCPLPGLPQARPATPSQSSLPGQLLGSLQAVKPSGQLLPVGTALPSSPEAAVLLEAARQLDAYFARQLTQFKLPLQPAGTPFQQSIWKALLDIPYGTTLSYRQLAANAGYTVKHSRATGTAVGRNPLAVILPCHRVLGHDGGLHGYSGGLDRKQLLLQLEGSLLL